MKQLIRQLLPEKWLAHLQGVDHYFNGEKELRLVRHLCDPTRVSLDVGANIGTYTYFMRRHSSALIAYEPNPELHGRLQRLYPEIEVRPCAVSDVAGQATLTMPVVSGQAMHELASLKAVISDQDEELSHAVQTVRLDEEDVGDVGFIKIDVERFELQVLRGALALIERCRPNILTEVSPLLYDQPVPDVFDFITERDYTGWFRFNGAYHPFADFRQDVHADKAQYRENFMGGNILLVPTERPVAALGPNR